MTNPTAKAIKARLDDNARQLRRCVRHSMLSFGERRMLVFEKVLIIAVEALEEIQGSSDKCLLGPPKDEFVTTEKAFKWGSHNAFAQQAGEAQQALEQIKEKVGA